MTYIMSITGALERCLRHFCDTEIALNAVERVSYYGNTIETESEPIIDNSRPPKKWPNNGNIKFIDFSMRYAPNLPLVVKNMSFEIKQKQKVGIVGRSGSGKTSLINALFRMAEPANGTVIIDGIDITTIGLHDLRKNISIIPQDPVLFYGSYRLNLDPFNEYTDMEIWDALEKSTLKTKISKDGLESIVLDGGDNLSVGIYKI